MERTVRNRGVSGLLKTRMQGIVSPAKAIVSEDGSGNQSGKLPGRLPNAPSKVTMQPAVLL